ncbi:MAG TPA: DUF1924 domain-containing protein [Burkholderiales bacterium]|nr:DUF1924 domain-containing protein [Burkholderiales bacterium]
MKRVLIIAGLLIAGTVQAAQPSALLEGYQAAARKADPAFSPSASRGAQFFDSPHGKEWSCATCHGNPPTSAGKHATTGKPIAALAPRANGERFTDAAKVEKWFRRNCNDVLGRACTPAEKADVLAWLLK